MEKLIKNVKEIGFFDDILKKNKNPFNEVEN
jgi:hypothetical protein